MINVVQNGDLYEITFPYDPIIVDMVKEVPGRFWNVADKKWLIPKERLGFFISKTQGTQYESFVQVISEEHINENATIGKTTHIPDIDISDVPFYVKEGSKPYQHQLDFMKWAIDRQNKGNLHGFICADEMGLSKTIEAANLAIYNKKKYDIKHCLIICCVNSVRYHWYDDIATHTQGLEVPYVLGTRRKRDGSEKIADAGGADKFKDLETMHKYGKEDTDPLPYFLITNIETFRYKNGRKYVFTDKIIDMISKNEISMVIIDEVHRNMSPTSMQGKQILRIKKATKDQAMWISLTGTPVTKQPMDVFTPLKLCDGHYFDSFYKWCDKFCIYGNYGREDIIGYKNIPELQNLLESNMIRRLKDDVLDLPPKIYYTEYVENTKYQEKLYKQTIVARQYTPEGLLVPLNPMTKILKLRQVNGAPELVDKDLSIDDTDYLAKNARLQRLLELLADAHERNEKTVVFSNWVEPLRTLYKFISKKYKTCVFTGTMSIEDREKHKKVFQTNPKYTVLLGTIGAAGTGITLTAARNAIFYDSPWNPSDKVQAEDRLHRLGTTQSVNIFTLVTKDTVDDKVEKILSTKSNVATYIVDGKLDLKNHPELLDYLLGGKQT